MSQILGQIGGLFNTLFTFPIFNLLMLLYHLFGDFGLSIIVLTIIVRLILFPLTVQQLRSQKAMQAIQPQMAEIRKKYAKDQKAQLQAMQALQKEYGVNPMAGCLPLLIQFPVLYGLFFAFISVLRNATIHSINAIIYPFLPKLPPNANLAALTSLNWFTFINPAWHLPLGQADPTHILPILAAVATFVQLRMAQPINTSGAKDAMTQQTQMLQLFMPVMIFIFALNYQAGLALYWTVSSSFGIVQQYFITGWGSLFILPSFLGGSSNTKTNNKSTTSSKTYTGNQSKQTRIIQQAEEPEAAEVSSEDGEGPIARNLRTAPSKNGSTSSRRRSRNTSASARRRSGNTPKRNPSRS